jgi:hypothetical protein
MQAAACSSTTRGEIVRDILMVSSFGFWAVALGLVPVLALGMLMGS